MSDVTTELAKEASDKAMQIERLKAENDRLREQSERLFDKTLELATENSKLRGLCKLCEREAENDKLQNNADLLRAMWSQERTEKQCYMAENAKLRELATFALKHIIEFECEELDRETLRGKPCEDCADYGSSDCPKCMPRMFSVLGIEVDG